MIKKSCHQFPIRMMCKLLLVSPSGYYDWVSRNPSIREQENAKLALKIEAIFVDERARVGAKRISKRLKAEGSSVGRHRVARIMRAHGWRAKNDLIKIRAEQLLGHVVLGHYAEVKNILETTADVDYLRGILTYVGKVTASSGQVMKGTALRLALAAEDVDFINEQGRKTIDGMAELIMVHMRRLQESKTEPEGVALMASQIATQFPEGWEKEEQAKHDANVLALKAVRAAIADSKDDADCEEVLQNFRNHINPRGVIETGKQWDAGLLQAALNLGYEEYNNFDGRRNDLYYVKVVGYIQRLAADNYAQAQAQGLRHILEAGEKLKRSLAFRYGGGSYFPLPVGSSGLGHNYWAFAGSGPGQPPFRHGSLRPECLGRFSKLCTSKNNIVSRIITQEPEAQSKPWCLVM